jgi:hypothetical protein
VRTHGLRPRHQENTSVRFKWIPPKQISKIAPLMTAMPANDINGSRNQPGLGPRCPTLSRRSQSGPCRIRLLRLACHTQSPSFPRIGIVGRSLHAVVLNDWVRHRKISPVLVSTLDKVQTSPPFPVSRTPGFNPEGPNATPQADKVQRPPPKSEE